MSNLPGIGQRTAYRLVLHMLRQAPTDIHQLSNALRELVDGIRYCRTCHCVSETTSCAFCSSHKRSSQGQLCVVEELHDMVAIESTGQYSGLYHILGGVISPLRGIGAENLNIQTLKTRLKENHTQIKEVIFALSPTIEGDTTTHYLKKQLDPYVSHFTILARGLPHGSELEYTDALTLGQSLSRRNPYLLTQRKEND